jgi:aromatic ring hydroxylase
MIPTPTDADHIASSRDGCPIYIDGEHVNDVTGHQAFHNATCPAAALHDFHSDAVLSFDDVRVGSERVFVGQNIEMTLQLFHVTPAHVFENCQRRIRLLVKMPLSFRREDARLGMTCFERQARPTYFGG